jgi:hypothetical protein
MLQQLHDSRVLDLNADSAECCPVPGLRHWLAVGTYQLQESTQQRLGRLYLFALAADHRWKLANYSSTQQLQVPGIFDLKWWPHSWPGAGSPAVAAVLGGALADSSLRLFRATQQQPETQGVSDGEKPLAD